jgi:hypothetical protein
MQILFFIDAIVYNKIAFEEDEVDERQRGKGELSSTTTTNKPPQQTILGNNFNKPASFSNTNFNPIMLPNMAYQPVFMPPPHPMPPYFFRARSLQDPIGNLEHHENDSLKPMTRIAGNIKRLKIFY